MRTLFALAPVMMMTACATYPPYPGPGPMPGSVAGTSWRVVAVNGRATPPSPEFFMNFRQANFSSKFGCNGIGADYVQRGNVIDPGPTVGTKIACPDMSYEIQANRILAQDMTIVWNRPNAIRLVNRGGSIALRR